MLKDRVKVSTSTQGTGILSIGDPFTSFAGFNSLGSGNIKTYYTLVNNSEWETGVGTYNSDNQTLSRNAIFESSNAGTHINLSGTSTLFISYPARTSVFLEEDQTPSSGNLLFFNEDGFQSRNLNNNDIVSALGYIPPNPTGTIQTGSSILDGTIYYNLSTTDSFTVDISDAQSLKYIIKAEYNEDIQILECLAVRKSNVVYNTLYGSLHTTDEPIINVDTNGIGGFINLNITPINANTNIKLYKINIQ